MFKSTITLSKAGHYGLTIRLGKRVVYRDGLISTLQTARVIRDDFIASNA